MRRHMRHDVDGVGDDEQDRVARVLHDERHDLCKHRHVVLKHLEPGLAGHSRRPRGDDHYTAARQVSVISGAHRERMRERYRVKNIVGLGLGTGAGAIYQNNLAAHPVHNQGEGGGRTDPSRAHDANFHTLIAIVAALGAANSSSPPAEDATRPRLVSFTLSTLVIWGPCTERKTKHASGVSLKSAFNRSNPLSRLRVSWGLPQSHVMNVTKDDITTYLKQVINDGAEYAKADGLKTIGEWFPGVNLGQLASQEFEATLETDAEREEFARLFKEVLAEVCTPQVLSRKVTDWIPLK